MGRIRSTREVEAGNAYAVDPQVDAMLDNWGRWAAQRAGGRPAVNPQFRQAVRGVRWANGGGGALGAVCVLRVDEAWRVEQTVCTPMFSPRYRTLLTEHYAHQRKPLAICKLLHIHLLAYDAELWKATCLFVDAFNRRWPDYVWTS
jgi:hypothetical protein